MKEKRGGDEMKERKILDVRRQTLKVNGKKNHYIQFFFLFLYKSNYVV